MRRATKKGARVEGNEEKKKQIKRKGQEKGKGKYLVYLTDQEIPIRYGTIQKFISVSPKVNHCIFHYPN